MPRVVAVERAALRPGAGAAEHAQDLVNGLKAADVDVPGRKRLWGRNVLVVAQVSISLMLLTAAFLMVRGFRHSLLEGTGFAKDHLLMVRFDPRLVQYNTAQTQQFYKLLAERVRLVPGVQSAALTRNPPLGLDEFGAVAFVPDGFEMPRDRENFTSTMDTVDEGYFETMGIPIVRGRGFRASDTADAPRVAVVNEQFAKHYWPGADAVGKHIRLDSRTGAPVEIVGVAQTIKYRSNHRKAEGFRVSAAGPASCSANGAAVAVERRSAAIGPAGEGRGPGARSEPADVADAGPTKTCTGTTRWTDRE